MTASETVISQQANTNYCANPPSTKFDVNDIVMHFGREYYTMLSCDPARLHCFYGKQSTLLHSQEEDTEACVCFGLEEIHNRIVTMGYNGTRVVIANIDCQPSMNGGILIFVLGTFHWPEGKSRKFAQTFLLAEQPNGYFVLNDIMRIIAIEENQVKFNQMANKPNQTSSTNQEQSRPTASTVSSSTTKETPAVPAQDTAYLSTESDPKVNQVEPSSSSSSSSSKVTTYQSVERRKTMAKSEVSSSEKETKKDPVVESTPSSWAKLAAVQQNRWGNGVVAETKGPVASIPIEDEPGKRKSNNAFPKSYDNTGPRDVRYNYNSSSRLLMPDNARPGQKKSEFDPSKSIYVHGLSSDITRDSFRKLFEPYGTLKSFDVVPSKGIAFAEFQTIEGQAAALKATISWNNCAVSVEPRRAYAPKRDSGRFNPRQQA